MGLMKVAAERAFALGCVYGSRLPSIGIHTMPAVFGSRKDCSSHTSSDNYGFKHFPDVVSEQQFKVPSFGGIVWIKSPLDVKLKPAGTLEYPNLDQAFVRLLSRDNATADVGLDVKQEDHKLFITGRGNITDRKTFLADVEVPIVHNVNITTLNGACIDIRDFMESSYVNLSAESGSVNAHQIKTDNLTIQCESGDVMCHGQLHGNIKITNQSGNIICEKRFVGSNVELETDTGDIRVASCYSELSKFSTNRGRMNLRNIHNESYVAIYEQGDLKMNGIDGSTNIFVKKGDVEAQVSRITHESRIHVEEGDVHLKLNDKFPLKVSIDANDVIPDTKFRSYGMAEKKENSEYVHYFAAIEPNKFSPTLVVVAENGNVIIDSQDWAASLGLKLKPGSDLFY